MRAEVGSRVRVQFAHKEYVGTVSALDVTPETAVERIQSVLSVEEGLPSVLPEEIRFWKAVASYYLCSVGEVYKAAYPALKREQEAVQAREQERLESRMEVLRAKMDKARRDDTRERYADALRALEERLQAQDVLSLGKDVELTPAQDAAAKAIRDAFSRGKTALLEGGPGNASRREKRPVSRSRNRPFPTIGTADRRRLPERAGLPFRRIRHSQADCRHPGAVGRSLPGSRDPVGPVPPPPRAWAHHRGRRARHFL